MRALRTITGRFLLRAAGLILICGAVAAVHCYRHQGWGAGTVPCLAWSMLWALIMGHLGFRNMQLAFRVPPRELGKTVFVGLFARVAVLAGSQGAVFLAIDSVWGARSLLATTIFYVIVLGVEVYSLAVETKQGTVGRKILDASGADTNSVSNAATDE